MVLYTIPNCMKCKIVKSSLIAYEVDYISSSDMDKITELGIMSFPTMELDSGELIGYDEILNRLAEGTLNGATN